MQVLSTTEGVDDNIKLHGVLENTIEPLQGAVVTEDTLIVQDP